MGPAEYTVAVAELAAVARLHRYGQPHPWPSRECLDCATIRRWRRELAERCPGRVFRLAPI